MRFFRTAKDDLYEAVRLQLDAEWGHPSGGTVTCIEPAATAPRDEAGRILLAVQTSFAEIDIVAEMLADLLASGDVEEIDESAYINSLPQPDPQP